jgi:hypothetical protein
MIDWHGVTHHVFVMRVYVETARAYSYSAKVSPDTETSATKAIEAALKHAEHAIALLEKQ